MSPLPFVEIPVGKDTTQLYSSSSTICHSGLSAYSGHFWSYLLCDRTTIKAEDRHISVISQGTPDGIHESGVVYVYEKVNVPTEVSAEVPPCDLDEWRKGQSKTPENAREALEGSISTPSPRNSLAALIKRPCFWSVAG